ncbi:unnamed protein product [Paramecium sonneborni]|uniref:Uncharacterized protein n=1 Tax=Paramecium sonneborni TaxID=65129 RepID=A0A8S1R646_9CILI|nr:unnamed protein product [Paramecium sonneborni]
MNENQLKVLFLYEVRVIQEEIVDLGQLQRNKNIQKRMRQGQQKNNKRILINKNLINLDHIFDISFDVSQKVKMEIKSSPVRKQLRNMVQKMILDM